MTEQEAIEWIKKIYIDTNQSEKCISLKLAISALMEIQQYRTIGTVEECREAREKQMEKKPIGSSSDGTWYIDTYSCPSCGEKFSGIGIPEYCPYCGQALDWST